MKISNFHYSYDLNNSVCDRFVESRLPNSSWKGGILPVYFHMDGLYPAKCAVPVYGFIVPLWAFLVIIANGLILVIFSKPHIRSHTTFILTLIGVADSLNISLPSIFYIYTYTLGNHRDYIPSHLCLPAYLLFHLLPEMFNLVSIWSTLLLACIRFRCLQAPFKAKDLHTNRRIAIGISAVFVIAMGVQLPSIGLFDFIPANVTSLLTNQTMETCIVTTSKSLNNICVLREIHLWVELFANSFIPCFAIIAIDIAILYTLRKAERRRGSLHILGTSYKLKQKKTSSERNSCTQSMIKDSTFSLSKEMRNYRLSSNDQVPIKKDNAELRILNKGLTNSETKNIQNKKLNTYDTNASTMSVVNALVDSSDFSDRQNDYRRRTYSDTSFPKRCQKRVASVLSIPGTMTKQFRSSFFHDSTMSVFKNSTSRRTESFRRLAKESRRTSWMIFAVVALISSHELINGVLFAHQIIHNEGPIPLNFFGCGAVYLSLWQYVTYPMIFLIYCFMSAAFRLELRRTLRCFKIKLEAKSSRPRNSIFMSPCAVRKSISLELEDKECSKNLMAE